jgi:hypothetical protein
MADLKATLTLTGTAADLGSTLSLSVTDTGSVVSPTVGVSIKSATTTGASTVIVPNVDSTKYVYIKHTGLNSAGGSSGADQVKVETADGTEIIRLSKEEFAFFPYYGGAACKLQLEATANTVQVEYAYFTRA